MEDLPFGCLTISKFSIYTNMNLLQPEITVETLVIGKGWSDFIITKLFGEELAAQIISPLPMHVMEDC